MSTEANENTQAQPLPGLSHHQAFGDGPIVKSLGAGIPDSDLLRDRLVHREEFTKAMNVLSFHRTGRRWNGVMLGGFRSLVGEPNLLALPMTDDEAILLAGQGVKIQGEWL